MKSIFSRLLIKAHLRRCPRQAQSSHTIKSMLRLGLCGRLASVSFLNSLNQRGIALLMALSSLMVLTVAVVEFVYNVRIDYRLAVTNKERLQAYYLAKSALNFSKILLKYNKDAEKMLQNTGGTGALGIEVEPLYRIMPLSSQLLRSVLSGELTGMTPSDEEQAPAEGGGDESGDSSGEMMDSIHRGIGMFDKEGAQKFLSFDGDFSAEITEEQTKFDLNKIAGIETTSPAYDQRKQMLLTILGLPAFKDVFEGTQDAEKLVHALGDWVDQNDVVNEFEKVERGSEGSLYRDYSVKNGKFLTLSEMRLVVGMNDAVYKALLPYVTVYSAIDKINACWGDENMLRALIAHFTKNAGCTSPVAADDDAKMNPLVTAVKEACPDVNQMSAALYAALGLGTGSSGGAVGDASGQTAASAVVPGCAFQFSDLIVNSNLVFTIKASGTVGETQVTITNVLDTTDGNPNKWKTEYFRISP